MKFLRKITFLKLKWIAKLILWRHKPVIVGITGSMGKTTTKKAVKEVLASKYNVYASEKSMNTEFGLPITILRTDVPGNLTNVFAWVPILLGGITQIFKSGYPEVLILEMGVDTPGDMDYLLTIAKPDIAVITGIAGVHIEGFGSMAKLLKEKKKIITPPSKAVLNVDYPELEAASKIPNQKLTYGIENGDIRATQIKNSLNGLSFNIEYEGKKYKVKTKLFGDHSVYALLAAFSVGIHMKMTPEEIASSLEDTTSEKGRMNVLKGLKDSVIIDDSYNASPGAVLRAIEAVEQVRIGYRIVYVLGNMNELGKDAEKDHRDIGSRLGKTECDVLITIGENAKKWTADEAIKKGLSKDSVQNFMDPYSAGEYLKSIISEKDLILVKGSQSGVFSEEVVKAVLVEKSDPSKVLVRQSKSWIKKKKAYKYE